MALETLSTTGGYTITELDGTKRQVTEGQVTAIVLKELRDHMQLVIGHATITGAIREFLEANKINYEAALRDLPTDFLPDRFVSAL